jgi:hypothetical protein
MKALAAYMVKFVFVIICIVACNKKIAAQLPSLFSSRQDSTAVQNILKHSMFVKVIVSKSKIFVGEPVMALYKFYTSVSGQAAVLKQPEFSGCSVKELNFGDDPQTEIINGKTYTVYVIRKVQLTPVEPGKLSVGAATVINHVEIPNTQEFVSDKYDISVSNPASYVDVASLPQKDMPEKFYGITGSFTISASAVKNKVPVGENDHLIVTIKGSGNFDAINKPEITWPAGTEHFDGDDSQHVDQSNFPISGNRVFDIPFIGKEVGVITIPPISFSYFNTDSKTYQTISTDSIAVRFTKALPRKDEYTNIVNYDISNRKYLWIVGAIAVTVIAIGFVNYRRNKTHQQKKLAVLTTTPAPVFEPALQFKYKTDFSRYWNGLQSITETKLFFTKAKELLLQAISERTDSQHRTETFLIAELKQKADAGLCKKVFSLMELCNEKIYAPFESETDLHFYFNEVKETIEQLQNEV